MATKNAYLHFRSGVCEAADLEKCSKAMAVTLLLWKRVPPGEMGTLKLIPTP